MAAPKKLLPWGYVRESYFDMAEKALKEAGAMIDYSQFPVWQTNALIGMTNNQGQLPGEMLVTSASGQVRIASPHEIASNHIIQSVIMDGRPLRIGMDPIEERMREIGFAVDFIERRTLLNENEYEDNHWYMGKLPCRFAGLRWCRLQWKYRCGPNDMIYDDSDGWHDVTPPWRTSVSSRIKRNHRYYACKDPSTCPYYAYRSVAPICVPHASDPTLHWELKCETVRKKEEKN